MAPLRYLASIFIDVFGITQPSAETRDQAAQYIAFLLLALVVALLLAVLLAVRFLGS